MVTFKALSAVKDQMNYRQDPSFVVSGTHWREQWCDRLNPNCIVRACCTKPCLIIKTYLNNEYGAIIPK